MKSTSILSAGVVDDYVRELCHSIVYSSFTVDVCTCIYMCDIVQPYTNPLRTKEKKMTTKQREVQEGLEQRYSKKELEKDRKALNDATKNLLADIRALFAKNGKLDQFVSNEKLALSELDDLYGELMLLKETIVEVQAEHK